MKAFPLYWSVCTILFIACSQSDENPEEESQSNITVENPENTVKNELNGHQEFPDTLTAQKRDTVKYMDLSHYPEEVDEVHISIEGDYINVWSDDLEDLEISARVESAITVMDEGPHCDLDDWIHGYTPWVELPQIDYRDPRYPSYSRFEFELLDYDRKQPFPIKDMDLIRKQVRKKCGDFWANHIKDSKTPWEYPSDVGISAFIFRVDATLKETGERKRYYIRVPQLMGC